MNELLVHYLNHSRTLTSQTEDWHRSLTIMGISPASVGDQSEVALDERVVELRPSSTDRAGLRSDLKSGN